MDRDYSSQALELHFSQYGRVLRFVSTLLRLSLKGVATGLGSDTLLALPPSAQVNVNKRNPGRRWAIVTMSDPYEGECIPIQV